MGNKPLLLDKRMHINEIIKTVEKAIKIKETFCSVFCFYKLYVAIFL